MKAFWKQRCPVALAGDVQSQLAGLWVTVTLDDEAGHCQVRNCSCNVQLVFLGEMMGSVDCIIRFLIATQENNEEVAGWLPGLSAWAAYRCLRRHRLRQLSVKDAER